MTEKQYNDADSTLCWQSVHNANKDKHGSALERHWLGPGIGHFSHPLHK